MEKIKQTQTLQNLEYGNLPCYGLICKDTQHYLGNMKKAVQMKHTDKSFHILSFFGEYPLDETELNTKKDWEFFLCVEVELFDNILQAYNSANFKAMAELSKEHKEVAFIFPLILKNYELIRSGKKNVFALEMDRDGKKNYLFHIDRTLLATLTYFDH